MSRLESLIASRIFQLLIIVCAAGFITMMVFLIWHITGAMQ